MRKNGVVHFLKNSYALRRATRLHLIISVALFMVILFFVFHNTVVQSNDKELHEAQASLNQAQMMNDTYLRSISNYMLQAMDSYDVRATLYGATFTEYLSIRSRAIYDSLTDVSSLISSVELVNFNTQTVLDGNGRYSFDIFGDAELLTLLEGYTPSSRTHVYFLPRVMNISPTRTRRSDKQVISMIFYLNKAGALVVNLDAATYQKLMLTDYIGVMTDYMLINNEGMVFSSSDPALFAHAPAEAEIYRQVMERPSNQGTFAAENGRLSVTYIKNTAMGVTYVAITRMEDVSPGSRNFWSILALGVIFLLSSLLLSLVFGLISSMPIRRLRHAVGSRMEAEADAQETNEFRFIENAYQTVVESNQNLREQVEIYNREKEGQMLLNLMNPASPSLRPSAATVNELETQFPAEQYQVIAVMPDRRHITLETDAQAIRKIMAEAGKRLLSALGTVRAVMPPSFQMLFLLNAEAVNTSACREALAALLDACACESGGKRFFMGVGRAVQSLDELNLSYSGAEEALQQAYIRRCDAPIFSESLTFPDLREQAYDGEVDAALARAVRHMDGDAAEALLTAYIDTISRFEYNQFIRNLLHLSVSMSKLESSLQIETDETSHSLDITTAMHWDAEEAQAFFVHRARLDIAQLSDMKKQRSGDQELMLQVNEMIEANIYNPEFSINQIADHFSFSVNYLRSLYKAASGESLSGRITRRRLETACELLDHTDETIESITAKLGFSTRNYFFTFFKKHMGMTPTQYRNREQN